MRSFLFALTLCLIAPMADAKPATCRSWQGMEVPYMGDPTFETLGMATEDKKGRPIIIVNPQRLEAFAPMAREFWLAHTCGHHALSPAYNTEAEADCYAMRVLKKRKIRRPEQMDELIDALTNLPEDAWPGHRPDAARIEALRSCDAD